MTDLLGSVTSGVGALLGGVADTATSLVGGTVSYLARPGDTLAGIADAHGVPLSAVVDANPAIAHLAEAPAGVEVSVPLSAAEPQASEAVAEPDFSNAGAGPEGASSLQASGAMGSASQASGSLPTVQTSLASEGTAFAGAADWRVLAQAEPPVLRPAGSDPLSSAPLSTLFAEAVEAGGGRLPPELQTASTGRLAQALASLGWSPVAAAAGRPGDVVILMLADGLHAARLGADGLLGQASTLIAPAATEAEPLSADLATGAAAGTDALLVRPPGQPPGVDIAAPQARGARPGEEAKARTGARKSAQGEPTESPQRAWITRVLPAANAVKARWGVLTGVTVAHGALASDWGRIAPGNDFFGLQAGRSTGAVGRALVLRSYESLEEAALDYGALLRGDRRLAPAFRHPDATRFAKALAEGGFGGPRYAERMDALITLNDLAALD